MTSVDAQCAGDGRGAVGALGAGRGAFGPGGGTGDAPEVCGAPMARGSNPGTFPKSDGGK